MRRVSCARAEPRQGTASYWHARQALPLTSAAMMSTVDRIDTARRDMSPMLPMGVDTRYSLPGCAAPTSPDAVLCCAQARHRPLTRGDLAKTGAMNVVRIFLKSELDMLNEYRILPSDYFW